MDSKQLAHNPCRGQCSNSCIHSHNRQSARNTCRDKLVRCCMAARRHQHFSHSRHRPIRWIQQPSDTFHRHRHPLTYLLSHHHSDHQQHHNSPIYRPQHRRPRHLFSISSNHHSAIPHTVLRHSSTPIHHQHHCHQQQPPQCMHNIHTYRHIHRQCSRPKRSDTTPRSLPLQLPLPHNTHLT